MRNAYGWMAIATRALVVTGTLLIAAGCQDPPIDEPGTAEVEPNSTFRSATAVALATDDSAVMTGAIDYADDVDVFDLGAVSAGDVIAIDVTRRSSALRSGIALFDTEGEIINQDTDSSVVDANADPSLSHLVRSDEDSIFLAISHNYARTTTGEYEIAVSIERAAKTPTTTSQILLLNFEGGVATDPLIGTVEFDPFDAGNIDPIYDGSTEAMKAVIRSTFEQNYERFNVIIIDTDNDERPAAGTYSEVFFGEYSTLAFGVAQQVDLYNQSPSDTAIVFTESFVPHAFGGTPTAEEMAVAIGNVGTHEAGHILGLSHVRDATAIMDEASPASTLLADQEFKSTALSPLVFPLGLQDSVELLQVTVGANPLAAKVEWPVQTFVTNSPLPVVLYSTDGLYQTSTSGAPMGKCLNCMMEAEKAGLLPAGIDLHLNHSHD